MRYVGAGGGLARGTALLLVLLGLGLVSLVMVVLVGRVADQLHEVRGELGEVQARAMAERGLALAWHPEIEAGHPALSGEWGGGGYRARRGTEEGRLALGMLLEEEGREVFRRLLGHWGMGLAEADALIDAAADWVDADDLRRLRGAESADYEQAGLPYNRPFASLDEFRMVRGAWRLDELAPRWRDVLTAEDVGWLDLAEAGAEAIAAATGVELGTAQRFVRARAGADGVHGTADDVELGGLVEALARLGVAGEFEAGYELDVGGEMVRLEAVGWWGDVVVRIVANPEAGGGWRRYELRRAMARGELAPGVVAGEGVR